jgi:hypothetical protein
MHWPDDRRPTSALQSGRGMDKEIESVPSAGKKDQLHELLPRSFLLRCSCTALLLSSHWRRRPTVHVLRIACPQQHASYLSHGHMQISYLRQHTHMLATHSCPRGSIGIGRATIPNPNHYMGINIRDSRGFCH